MSESREALAHQRLATRLLALRTQQLEDRLSRESDDSVTPHGNVSSVTAGNRSARASENFVTANGVGSNSAEDKLSPMSDNCVTPTDTGGRTVERNRVEPFDETWKSSDLQSGVSVDTTSDTASCRLTHSNDTAADVVSSCDA